MPEVTPRAGQISRFPLFAGLDDNELESLASHAIERRFEPEEVLFWEGDRAQGIFLLVEGAVKIFKTSATGREMMLDMVSAPSSVAELPLFDGGPYPASARAVKVAATLFINNSDFYLACRQNPDLPLKILAVVGRRLRTLVMVVESITFGSVTKRLAKLLLDLTGEQPGGGITLTHQELASRLGTVREVVSRNLARFRVQGFIKIEDREISVVDPAGLKGEMEAEG
jgi:CRP/FNR family transcriptional regulator, cyclic AMP receptor protein